MDHRYGFQGGGISRLMKDGDFEEQDVWDVIKERRDNTGAKSEVPRRPSYSVSRNISSTAVVIPGAKSAISTTNSRNFKQQSAPVRIPDWSSFHEKKSTVASKNAASNEDGEKELNDDSDSDDEGDYRMPPHEIIDRRAARTKMSSFSVYEGAGRTLKGRDLWRLRDDVLRKTGFLE